MCRAFLITGSAVLVFACGGGNTEPEDRDEGVVTEQSDTLSILQSENGLRSYRFQAPLMEAYGFAKEPYREFRRGIYIETYNDTTGSVESTLIADYAINYENQKLWEAKGNVVATNAKGQVLETQQLFWNQRTRRIYSNIDSRLTQGEDVLVGVGFESDEDFEQWEFRQPRGKLAVEMEPNRDTTTNRPGTGADTVPAVAAVPAGTIVTGRSATPGPRRNDTRSPGTSPQTPNTRGVREATPPMDRQGSPGRTTAPPVSDRNVTGTIEIQPARAQDE